jgi:hypothetical protein
MPTVHGVEGRSPLLRLEHGDPRPAVDGDVRQRRDQQSREDNEPKDVIELAGEAGPPLAEPPTPEAETEAPAVEPGGLDLSA